MYQNVNSAFSNYGNSNENSRQVASKVGFEIRAKSFDEHLKKLSLNSWIKGPIQKAVILEAHREKVPVSAALTTGCLSHGIPQSVGVPSWSRSVEAAEAARARLVRWACGDPAADQDTAPRKKMPHALRRRWPFCPCLQGVPSWSRSVEAAEAARARLVRWACGDPAADQDTAPRKKMPHALRRRWPFCPCLQNDEPPEITYCVVGGEGALALHAVTPTHPMPPQDELDAKFAELVVSTKQ
ncbi:hypothetical protein RR46_14419 [Papilio xuthus]|uniref:Uncharacterized protein n=1 Tax=Papilio xuthus TaxID=66420 RepID=A0A194PIK0_PAPXU|nr:hypothetical protein RR46_14419 [Papilio xuthus]